MRRSCGMLLVVVGLIWIGPLSAKADQTPGHVLNSRRPAPTSVLRLSDRTPTPAVAVRAEPATTNATTTIATTTNAEATPTVVAHAATAGTQTPESAAVERKILGRVSGYQALLDREGKLLAQRMAYAGKLRQQGLDKEDKRLLDKAEEYERASMAAYLSKVQQFEKARFSAGVQQSSASATSAPRPAAATPRVQGSSNTRSPRSASSSSNSRRSRRSRSYGR